MTKVLVVYSTLETLVIQKELTIVSHMITNIYFFLISHYLHAATTGFRNSDIHR